MYPCLSSRWCRHVVASKTLIVSIPDACREPHSCHCLRLAASAQVVCGEAMLSVGHSVSQSWPTSPDDPGICARGDEGSNVVSDRRRREAVETVVRMPRVWVGPFGLSGVRVHAGASTHASVNLAHALALTSVSELGYTSLDMCAHTLIELVPFTWAQLCHTHGMLFWVAACVASLSAWRRVRGGCNCHRAPLRGVGIFTSDRDREAMGSARSHDDACCRPVASGSVRGHRCWECDVCAQKHRRVYYRAPNTDETCMRDGRFGLRVGAGRWIQACTTSKKEGVALSSRGRSGSVAWRRRQRQRRRHAALAGCGARNASRRAMERVRGTSRPCRAPCGCVCRADGGGTQPGNETCTMQALLAAFLRAISRTRSAARGAGVSSV